MKLTGRTTFILIILTIILAIEMISSVETENEKNFRPKISLFPLRNTRRRYRNVYEVCSQSIPNFNRVYGNIPCPRGTICRPPMSSSMMNMSGTSSRCYPDKYKGRSTKNFVFTPTSSRRLSTSYTYKIRERGGSWVYVAGPMQECYKSIPGYRARKCLPGYVCAPLKSQSGLSGVTSFCQSQKSVKKPTFLNDGDECRQGNTGGRMCPPSTVCRSQIKSKKLQRGNLIYTVNSKGYYCLAENPYLKLSYTPSGRRCNRGSRCSPGNTCRNFYLNGQNKGAFCLPSVSRNIRTSYRTRTIRRVTRYVNGVKVSDSIY